MTDVGLESLDSIHRTLLIDESWTVHEQRAFTWTAHRLAVRVEASPMFISRDIPISRVTTTIDVIKDVRGDRAQVEDMLGVLNAFAVYGALVYYSDERTVKMMTAHNVHVETISWRPDELASAQILALGEAERFADPLADALKGRVAEWAHPRSGIRSVPDEMLTVFERIYEPVGSEPSRFALADEMLAIHGMVRDTYDFSLGGDAGGINIEVAFGESDTSLIELKADNPHPRIGNGLLVGMTARIGGDPAECAGVANGLNRVQFQPGQVVSGFGAWCVREVGGQHCLAHSHFVPNADYAPQRSLERAQSAINRAIWVDDILFPGLGRRSSLPALMKREALGPVV